MGNYIIILDFEGTLFTFKGDYEQLRKSLSQVFKQHGLDITVRPIIEKTQEGLELLKDKGFTKKQLNQIRKDLYKAQEKFEHDNINKFTILPGADMLINFIKDKNTYIISNNISSTIESVFQKNNLEYDGIIIGKEKILNPKPNPEGFNKYVKKNPADKIFMIGDSDHDVQLAKNINAVSIIIKSPSSKIFNLSSNYIVKDLHDCVKLLTQLQS